MPSNFEKAIQAITEKSTVKGPYQPNWKGLIDAIRDWSGTGGGGGGGGEPGQAATIEVGTTNTLPANSDATVVNSGTSSAAVFNFGIPQGPQGEQGEKGDKGDDGTPGTGITLQGSLDYVGPPVDIVAPEDGDLYIDSNGDGWAYDGAEWTNVGKIQGPEGPEGPAGADSQVPGPQGDAATITVGGTNTLSPGSSATVVNTGTSSEAVFVFGIPKGDPGTAAEFYVSKVDDDTAAGNITFEQNIIVDGNVGIGEDTPGSKLTVKDGDIALVDGDNVSAAGHSIRFFGAGIDDNSTNYAEIKGALNNYTPGQTQRGALVFNTSGAEAMRIDPDGKVGIGTDSPSGNLEIKTGTGIAKFKQSSSNLATTLEFLRNGVGTITNNAIEVSNSEGLAAYINYSGGAYFGRDVGIGTNIPSERLVLADVAEPTGFSDTAMSMIRSDYGGRIAGYIEQGVGHGMTFATIDSTTPTERMRITGDGNVGINTTNPDMPLKVGEDTPSGCVRLGKTQAFMLAGSSNSGAVYFGPTLANPTAGIEASWDSADNRPAVTVGVIRDGNGSTGGGAKPKTSWRYDNSIRHYINNQEVYRVFETGINIPNGKGVTFNVDGGGGVVSSNSLTDYEVGTFTPSLTDATSYKYRDGAYTKIGDTVYFYIRVEATASTPSSSPWQITGLPFASANADIFGGAWRSYGKNVFSTVDPVNFHIPKNATGILAKSGGNGSSNIATNNASYVTLNNQIILNGFYKAAGG